MFLKGAVKYTLPYLMPNNEYANSKITISISNLKKGHVKGDRGSCEFTPAKRSVCIRLHEKLIRKSPNLRIWTRHYQALHYIMHELVHAKQYLTGEVREHKDGKRYIYKGKVFTNPDEKDLDAYYSQPIEIEAYGRAEGLVVRFYQEWKRLKNE